MADAQAPPSDWLVRHADLLPNNGVALDLACGRGRHASWLAGAGLEVHAVDRDPDAIETVRRMAARRGLRIHTDVLDLEAGPLPFNRGCYDVIVGFHYLHRPLFPTLIDALRSNGLLVYETFTIAQAARGKPTNPAFLLRPGELVRLVEPLTVVRSREGEFGGRDIASVVARKTFELPAFDGA
ncbi:MAG: class I SAM-dependent methyltransferase [Vicinamibacterales bacterium]